MSEDEYQPTEFLKNHRDLFKSYNFKFEGLSDETEKDFVKVVKDMGGNVSDDTEYTLCEIEYFKTDKNNNREDLYDISYIYDSIIEEKPQNIQNYRFVAEKSIQCENRNALCTVAKLAIKNDYSYRLYFKKVLCESCKKNNEENVSSSAKSVNGRNKMKGIDDHSCIDKDLEKANHSLKNQMHNISITDKNNTDSIKSTNHASTSQASIVPNIKIESPESVQKFKDDVICISEDEVLEETNSKENNNQSNSGWIDSIAFDKQKVTKKRKNSSDTDSDGLSMDTDDEQKHYDNFKLWWKPSKVPKDQACDFQSCTFEPHPHLKHPLPTRFLSLVEKKIILKFFISTNNIPCAKGARAYEKMHEQGYLKHRSTETLRNCFRRTILPDIYTFGLPNDIVKEFRNLDGAQRKKKN